MAVNEDTRAAFSSLSRHFGDFICRSSVPFSSELWLAAAVACERSLAGHLYTDLPALAGQPVRNVVANAPENECFPDWSHWQAILDRSVAIHRGGNGAPLVLDAEGWLYLHKFWSQQEYCAEQILNRAAAQNLTVDLELLKDGLRRLFPAEDSDHLDLQKWAAALGVCRKLLILSGGPGTGKTTTIVKLLVLLLEQAKGGPVKISLAAPTGKAAQRMKDALMQGRDAIGCNELIKEALPQEAVTLHRLLEAIAGGKAFRYNRDNPLPVDVLIIDEASMVDLAMMNRVLEALPATATLILVGDRDQLASVEPGSVFGDICLSAASVGYSFQNLELASALDFPLELLKRRVSAASPLGDCLVTLEKNHRFAEAPGVAAVCKALSSEDSAVALNVVLKNNYPDVHWQPFPSHAHELGILCHHWLNTRLFELFRAEDPQTALSFLSKSMILTPLRRGPFGVEGINQKIAGLLQATGVTPYGANYYAGRPILIQRNDYRLQLFNGDVGIIWPDAENEGELRAFFPDGEGRVRSVALSMLPNFESAYAMTIHKSQGSEFENILLMVPPCPAGVIHRELLYTAISRARKSIEIFGDVEFLTEGFSQRIARESSLIKFIFGAGKVVA